ncbi:MAG TPA: FKBP-type peptidyl-prolyl cis-trans isomerase [Candidatus Acidoferrales bacterium]
MQRPLIFSSVTLCAAALLLAGNCLAHQTPVPNAPQAPASGSTAAPAAKTQKAPAPKTGTTPSKSAAPLALNTNKDKVSYAIGINIGKSMKKDGVDVDPSILLRGLKDGIAGTKPLLTDQEAQAAIVSLQADMKKKAEEARAQAGTANKTAGDTFLASNKSKPGIVTTADGLQYKVISQGTGPKPTAADTVTVQYKGTLLDGKEFDSSYKRGQPATFPVGQIIKGWTEALQLMPVGSKYELFIPSDLAYGDRGAGPDIGPNSTLIFEVELLSIAPKTESQPAAAPSAQPQAQPQAPPQAQPQSQQPPPQSKP